MGCQLPPNKRGGSCCILVLARPLSARPLCIALALFLMRPASGQRCGEVNFPLLWSTHHLLPPRLSPCLPYRPLLLLHTWVIPWFPLYIQVHEIGVPPCHMRYMLELWWMYQTSPQVVIRLQPQSHPLVMYPRPLPHVFLSMLPPYMRPWRPSTSTYSPLPVSTIIGRRCGRALIMPPVGA
jgi:hypothetical protein